MVSKTSKNGTTKSFELDFDKICAYEQTHKDWSIMKEIEQLENMRFSSLDLLAKFIGAEGWKQFAADGFTADDLADVIKASLEELGFTSQAPESESSA